MRHNTRIFPSIAELVSGNFRAAKRNRVIITTLTRMAMSLKQLMLGMDDSIVCINFSEKNICEDFKYNREAPDFRVFI
jgi:hypothetical protein